MKKQSTERGGRSSVVWENLEEWVRGRIQEYLQDLLEEEITVFLGREKSERRAEIDSRSSSRWPSSVADGSVTNNTGI